MAYFDARCVVIQRLQRHIPGLVRCLPPPPVMPVVDSASLLARISLPLVYDPNVNGPEDVANLTLDIGSTLIGRYEIVAVLADGSSSRVYRSLDLLTNGMVAVKVRLH